LLSTLIPASRRPASTFCAIVIEGRVGLLEHHPYTQPRFGHPNALTINVLAVQEDLTGEASTGHELVHPVECAQVCRFPAPGWPNEGGDLAGRITSDTSRAPCCSRTSMRHPCLQDAFDLRGPHVIVPCWLHPSSTPARKAWLRQRPTLVPPRCHLPSLPSEPPVLGPPARRAWWVMAPRHRRRGAGRRARWGGRVRDRSWNIPKPRYCLTAMRGKSTRQQPRTAPQARLVPRCQARPAAAIATTASHGKASDKAQNASESSKARRPGSIKRARASALPDWCSPTVPSHPLWALSAADSWR